MEVYESLRSKDATGFMMHSSRSCRYHFTSQPT